LIDINTHRPLDLLADRTSETLAAWLREHPGAQIVCRDRAGAYAEGNRDGAPDAVQVADRWHLWHNLVEAVEKVVRQHRADLRDPALTKNTDTTNDTVTDTDTTSDLTCAAAPDADAQSTGSAAPTRLAARTQERYAAVQELAGAGATVSAISQTLGLDRKTVRRFARAASADELHSAHPTRASILDPYTDHLQQRWAGGVTDAVALTSEITALGYRGSVKTVRRYLHPLRDGQQNMTTQPSTPPSVREATGWLTRHPDSLNDEERRARDTVLDRSPALLATRDLVSEFAQILTQRRGNELKDWMSRVDNDGTPALRSFATGLERDLDAVTAGLTLPYSSGPVEGTVNRIKMIKRQMFGRANFDLLRKRVLLAT
jgi:transposase